MSQYIDPLEKFWTALLSREPKTIMDAYDSCTLSERHDILAHLNRMSTEPGWNIEQTKSARFALKVLKKIPE
jgi:hypothetical protein